MTQNLNDAGAAALPPVSEADRQNLPRGADQFMWTAEQKLVAHRNMHVLFPSQVIRAGAPVYPLPQGTQIDVDYKHRGVRYNIDSYMAANDATGLLVLKNGEAWSSATPGKQEHTLWASFDGNPSRPPWWGWPQRTVHQKCRRSVSRYVPS